jgi:hypothetical protein
MDFSWWRKAHERPAGSGAGLATVPDQSTRVEHTSGTESYHSQQECGEEIQHHSHHHRIELLPGHLVDVPEASHWLLQELKCDDWYVACRNDHQCVVRLTRGGIPHFAVSFQCTPAVDKAIYHGSRAWSVSIIPLQNEADLDGETLHRVKAGLAGLNKGPAMA